MILISLFLITTFLSGYWMTFWLSAKFNLWERIFLSFPLGFFVVSLLTFLAAHLFGLKPQVIFGVLFLLLALLLVFKKRLLRTKRAWLSYQDYKLSLALLIVAFIFAPVVIWVLDRTMLKVGENGGWYTSINNFGDLPWHMLFVSNFAYGDNFPPVHPIFPPNHLSFHFFIDFLSAIFLVLSHNFRLAFLLPGIALTLSIIFLSFLFVFRISKSLSVSFLSIFIFFFHGNLGLFDFIEKFFHSRMGFLSFLEQAANENLNFNKVFSNFLGAYLVAQRAYLFGFNLFLVNMFLFYLSLKERSEAGKRRYLFLIASFLGLGFFFDVHALIASGNIFLTLGIITALLKKYKILFKYWLISGMMVFFLIIPQFLWVLPNVTLTKSYMQFKPFWQEENFFEFWWQNLGLILPLGLLGFLIPKIINKITKMLAFSSLPIFVIFNLFLLTPHSGDNNRIIYYPIFFLAVAGANFLNFLLKKSRALIPVVFLLLLLTTGGGMISIYTRNKNLFQLFSPKDIKTALEIRKVTPPKAVILTAPIFNQPINTISGRRIFIGWDGYITTQGFPFNPRFSQLQRIYEGNPQAQELLGKNKIDYVFISHIEREKFQINEDFFTKNFQVVWQSEDFILYGKNPKQW